ncbi:MAG: preprotein translocase subunit YajC [Planctomycetota bacterium]|nr:MAG: preprotein translocase subunit YajC [Planctomycetota bacterium]
MITPTFSALTLLAQTTDGPSLPGAPAPAATSAATDAAATAAPSTSGGSGFMIMMVVLLGAMILFSFVNARREKKKRSDLLGNIKKHDKVLTIGGIVGTVVELKDDALILKVDETSNTRITFTKSSISQVLPMDSAA